VLKWGLMNLVGKKALVMGLGLHEGGLGVTRFLVEQGALVRVTDLRPPEVLAPTLKKLAGLPVEYVLGEHREEDFRWAEIVVKNPAVPRESPYLAVARQNGASIEMEMTIFARLSPSKHLIGISGTRGKTTTTLLTGAILQAWKPDTIIAGNLRVSALSKLPEIKPETPVVLELSSWQLEGFGEIKVSPPVAAVTNMSPDHLNRYRDMADYADAKRHIYRHQDQNGVVVLNAADALVKTFAADAPGKVIWFSPDGIPKYESGVYVWRDNIIWRDADEEVIAPTSAIQLVGRHNLYNALAAIAVAKAAGCPTELIGTALANFKGVPDRLELLRELNGVRFYNDTTSTSPAATVAALEAFRQSLGADSTAKIILMAGGADKQLQFEQMAEAIANPANRVKKLILLDGTATPRLAQTLEVAGVHELSKPYKVFREAVQDAFASAEAGDIVLLSPGCASFGLFTHEFDRGQQFKDLVKELRLER
jgi:UDP-N-acetylmuramoylalanine--D-glutamate ligase